MRITQSMYYKDIYGQNNSKLSRELFDVNKQIASGIKIQYAYEDVGVFADTMRLDNEMVSLGQIKNSTENGYNFSDQSDIVLNDFDLTMDRMKVLLIQSSNDSSSDTSRDAIAKELRGLEDHLKNLANTSINGQYLFSGSATNTKPISSDGTYMGNDTALNSFLGSSSKQQYNITGDTLFLGEESSLNREITTNVPQHSLSSKYPDFTDSTNIDDAKFITSSSTIRDLMGDNDDDILNSNPSHFYLSGTQSDGTSFTSQITLSANDSVDDLLVQIGNAYGNTSSVDVVNVSINDYGEIVIEDKMKGSSKIDFHMVGATDYNKTDGNDAGDINSAIYATAGLIDNLDDGETNFDSIMNGTSTAANTDLYIRNFVKSPYDTVTTPSSEFKSAEYVMDRAVAAGDTLSITVDNGDTTTTTYTQAFSTDAATTYDNLKTQIEANGDFSVSVVGDTITLNSTAQGVASGVSINTALANDNGSGNGVVTVTDTTVNSVVATDIDALLYDRTGFTKDGSTLSSSIPQIVNDTNAFATPSTKVSEVADLSQGTAGTINGTQFTLSGTTTSGSTYNAQIDFSSSGSTFTIGANTYDIFDMGSPRSAVNGDDMTYQQLMDVTNMIVTGNLPSPSPAGTATQYDSAITTSNLNGSTTLSYDGKIEFNDFSNSSTKASMALYDSNAGNFSSDASVMTFNSNNALTITDPKTDFFKTIDEMIKSVENGETYPDSSSGDVRNVGIENSIAMLDDLKNHLSRSHATVGSNSNSLLSSLERTETLEISTMTLRSSVIDTDLAEASLRLAQLNNNYEAMLMTVGDISKLSLVNYL